MTSRLRELIQQLGEAIHESVIESEQIAGVVSDIRQYGFDVLLMLEATIGLNEVTAKDAEDAETDEGAAEAPFTPNDLHFLRSLRISVEGEEEHGISAEGEEEDRGGTGTY
jgi:hypothetical protein